MAFNLKVFVTGKNKRIVKDVSEHCFDDRNYITIRCEPEKEFIFEVMHSEMPNVVIICMGNENEEDITVSGDDEDDDVVVNLNLDQTANAANPNAGQQPAQDNTDNNTEEED